MAKFEFKLQKVLDLRESEKRQAELELGRANSEVARIQNQLDAIAAKHVAVQQQLDSSGDFTFMANSQNYFIFLEQKKEQFLEEMVQAQMVQEQKRSVYMEAMKNVKVLEKLREKKLAEYKKQQAKLEQQEIEEIIMSRRAAQQS